MVMEGLLSMGRFRPYHQSQGMHGIGPEIVKKGLSARQVEALVKKGDGSACSDRSAGKICQYPRSRGKGQHRYGVNVTIEWDENKDIGSVHLKNCSHDQLENILIRLGVM